MIDEKLKPWLLEVNHSASFHCDSPLDSQIKKHVILDTLNLLNVSSKEKKQYLEEKGQVQFAYRKKEEKKGLQTEADSIDIDQVKIKKYEDKHKGAFMRIYPVDDNDPTDYLKMIKTANKIWSEGISPKKSAGQGVQEKRNVNPINRKVTITETIAPVDTLPSSLTQNHIPCISSSTQPEMESPKQKMQFIYDQQREFNFKGKTNESSRENRSLWKNPYSGTQEILSLTTLLGQSDDFHFACAENSSLNRIQQYPQTQNSPKKSCNQREQEAIQLNGQQLAQQKSLPPLHNQQPQPQLDFSQMIQHFQVNKIEVLSRQPQSLKNNLPQQGREQAFLQQDLVQDKLTPNFNSYINRDKPTNNLIQFQKSILKTQENISSNKQDGQQVQKQSRRYQNSTISQKEACNKYNQQPIVNPLRKNNIEHALDEEQSSLNSQSQKNSDLSEDQSLNEQVQNNRVLIALNSVVVQNISVISPIQTCQQECAKRLNVINIGMSNQDERVKEQMSLAQMTPKCIQLRMTMQKEPKFQARGIPQEFREGVNSEDPIGFHIVGNNSSCKQPKNAPRNSASYGIVGQNPQARGQSETYISDESMKSNRKRNTSLHFRPDSRPEIRSPFSANNSLLPSLQQRSQTNRIVSSHYNSKNLSFALNSHNQYGQLLHQQNIQCSQNSSLVLGKQNIQPLSSNPFFPSNPHFLQNPSKNVNQLSGFKKKKIHHSIDRQQLRNIILSGKLEKMQNLKSQSTLLCIPLMPAHQQQGGLPEQPNPINNVQQVNSPAFPNEINISLSAAPSINHAVEAVRAKSRLRQAKSYLNSINVNSQNSTLVSLNQQKSNNHSLPSHPIQKPSVL